MNSKYIRYVLSAATLCIAYFVTAKAGLSLDAVSGFATPVWPPTGIALAALLLYGYRLWPGILIAAFLVNLSTGASPLVALGIAIGNTLEPLLGTYLLNRFAGFNRSLQRVKDVLGLVILAALLSTMVSATIGVTSLFFGGVVSPATLQKTWIAWWVGDMLGALVITPFILVWANRPHFNLTFKKLLEPLVVFALLIVVSIAVFSGMLWEGIEPSTFAYLIFPPLIWVALRFGQRGSVSASLIVSAVAIWCTIIGPFTHPGELSQSLLLLQRFMGITAVTFMIISAIIAERERAEYNRRKLLAKTIRLNKQRSYLKDLNKAKDEFISLASHQLRTPVSGIKIHLGMLLQNFVGELTKKQLNSVHAAYMFNERQIQMIDDLLNIAQIDMGDIALRKEEADMKTIVSHVIDELSSTIANREQTINFVHGDDNYVTKVDRGKIAIALENLIDNASKYSSSGKRIEVELATAKDKLNITVRDEGVGIAKKDLGKLFKKFSRIDNELSIERGGNGLGLYWVKKIVNLHGGKITVTSKTGQGSVFTVAL